MIPIRKCKICKKDILGRTDKQYCSAKCKSEYNHRLQKVTKSATAEIDKILHRNRSTLLEIMGKNITQMKIPRVKLDKKKFNYSYITHFHVNNQGKTVQYVYDFSWMIFSDQEVLIKRIRKSPR
jgi:predicted nucleic acid-binding Zn ribbon protein